MMKKAFDLSDRYRNPVMLMADGIMGQMMEPVEIDDDYKVNMPPKPWATTGMVDHKCKNVINSCFVIPEEMEAVNVRLQKKYAEILRNEKAWEDYLLEGAEVILVAFGTASRICRAAVEKARDQGIPAGLIRPISLWPFPSEFIGEAADKAKCFLTVELNEGQMVEDVKLAVNGKAPVYHYGRSGGIVPLVKDVLEEIKKLHDGGADK